ncbi:MAG TPA: glycosyltransferase [Rhizomicrobium sp.]|nr:glycosyltransferase [Rhizomicrobium sp.]
MRILIFNNDYPSFLRKFYADMPGLASASHAEQIAARNASLFGVADFYSRNFRAHGHEAAEVHVNNDILQATWMCENGHAEASRGAFVRQAKGLEGLAWAVLRPLIRRLRGNILPAYQARALRFQIEAFRPDLILNQEMSYIGSSFLNTVRKPGRRIIGQIASALPVNDDFSAYDLVISSLPNLVQYFRGHGVTAALNRLAFDPSVLAAMESETLRDIDVSFVGSLSPDHEGRIALLEYLVARVPLKVWGNGIERLPATSPLHGVYQGEAWGRDMYQVLRRSRLTLNHHIDLAEDWANNMRLYEATGIGTMLLTDAKRNLGEMFVPGREVAVYSSPDDCVRKILYYLSHDEERAAIAAAGQMRTLHNHTYRIRTEEIAALAGGLHGATKGAA